MLHKRLIHAREDIEKILRFADSIDLHLLPDTLPTFDLRPWKPEQFRTIMRETIFLFRPEWVKGDLKPRLIEIGVDAGKYRLPPTNFSSVHLFFLGDENISGLRRLGPGGISFKRDYLAEPAHEIRPSPPEVEIVYKQLCKHLLSTITVSGGGHRYHVCKEAAALAAQMPTKPPFDYIPWPPPDLHKIAGKRGK